MNTYGMDLMGRRRRRRHSPEFKAAVIEECLRPGVSIAAIALAHGLNANMLRKWVTEGKHKLVASAPTPAPEPEAPQVPQPAYSTRWRTRLHADGGQCSSVMADAVPR